MTSVNKHRRFFYRTKMNRLLHNHTVVFEDSEREEEKKNQFTTMSTVNNNNEDTICGRSSSIITIGVVGGSGAGAFHFGNPLGDDNFNADSISRFLNPRLLLLNCAGKTTLAEEIYKELGFEKNVTYLTHDDYYKDISHKTLEERAKTNFDHPDSLDTDLLIQHVIELKQGK